MLRRPCGTGEECMEVARMVAVFVEEREHEGGDVWRGVVGVFWCLNGGSMYAEEVLFMVYWVKRILYCLILK